MTLCGERRGLAPLPRDFFARPAEEVAPGLLGCVLTHATPEGEVAVRLTEVEAYAGAADPASHAFRGQTPRTAVMFGPPGYVYVYFTYGMHFCMNLVCLPAGTASAVLVRAGEVVAGEDLARARRAPLKAAIPSRDLARGPARLCQALGVDRTMNGADACDPASALRIWKPAVGSASAVVTGPRVGIREAADVPWRFWLAGEATVSAYRAHTRRARV